MEMFPGRVPFSKEENFTPLRAPHNFATQSTLSANAQEFVPKQTVGAPPVATNQHQNFFPRSQGYQRPNHHQHHHQQQHHHHQNQHQQHYTANGYQRMPHHQQQQQQQQQQNQQYQQQQQNQRMNSLANDVQDRLKIKGGPHPNANNHRGNNSGNYYSQQQRPSTSHHNQHQQQHHHSHHSNSSNYKNNRDQGATSSRSSSSTDLQTVALDYLSTVLECLNRNPGQFDSVATRFLTIFDGMEDNQYVLSIAMEDIFKESIQNSNFRYMGAKLYNLLHMLNLKKDSLFLTLLKCKLDYHQQEVLEYMQTKDHGKVRETALFLAELYMQLRGDDSRIILLAENIVYSLKQLLGYETVENIRCICLTLKLAGFDLTSDCPKEVEEIIKALTEIETRTPGKYPIVASVLALQKDNWGRKLSTSVSLTESEGLPEPPRASDEPIFYGPDGRELTAEETDFLAGDAPPDNCASSDDEDDDFDLEMDEDAAKAYKEFCKLNATS